jgi:oxygen-independent coproporphyrinogen-3 oxidase
VGIDLDVRVGHVRSRGLLVGVLPHPFCNPSVAGCGFCTFPHEPHHNGKAAEVVSHVVREIEARANLWTFSSKVAGLYFGGGTANLAPAEPFRQLCRTLAECFDLSDAEVTLEGVPAYFVKRKPLLMDVMREEIKARHFRISMGVQTFDEARLRQMGRQAFGDVGTFAEAVEAAHQRGFTASADLLFNLPHQSLDEMRRDVDRADALGLDHLGLYHLVLFRGLGTAWSRDAELLAGLPDNETAARNWLDLRERLLGGGWAQTTLTNFERRAFLNHPDRFVYEEYGFQADRYEMLGFGPGGISFAADADFGGGLKLLNPDGSDAYLAAVQRGGAPWDRFFEYDAADLRVLYLTRRLAGLTIDRRNYRRLFRADVLKEFPAEIEALTDAKLLEVIHDSIRPTPLGVFYADSAASLLARRRTEARRKDLAGTKETLAARAYLHANDNRFGHM